MADAADDPFDLVVRRQQEATQRGAMSTWAVYDHPRDFPDLFVARRFESMRPNPEPVATNDIIASAVLEDIRECLARAGLARLPRFEGDEPQIVEVWL